jgi:hypothetical protein
MYLEQDDDKKSFDSIRTVRRKYLHLWSAEHLSLDRDAITCFHAAAKLVIASLGLGVKDGRVILREEIVTYLRPHGVSE